MATFPARNQQYLGPPHRTSPTALGRILAQDSSTSTRTMRVRLMPPHGALRVSKRRTSWSPCNIVSLVLRDLSQRPCRSVHQKNSRLQPREEDLSTISWPPW